MFTLQSADFASPNKTQAITNDVSILRIQLFAMQDMCSESIKYYNNTFNKAQLINIEARNKNRNKCINYLEKTHIKLEELSKIKNLTLSIDQYEELKNAVHNLQNEWHKTKYIPLRIDITAQVKINILIDFYNKILQTFIKYNNIFDNYKHQPAKQA